MYLIERHSGPAAVTAASSKPPFGPGFTQEEASKAVTLEVWGTGAKDPGPDYCEFIIKDEHNQVIATRRVNGY